MPISHKNGIQQAQPVVEQPCNFGRNNPYDRAAPIQLVIPKLPESKQVMDSIREFRVPENAFAIWYLGQNGFILKDTSGPLIGIDLYLTNSCASTYAHLSYRLDRQLPVFIEPEDLDIDVFITTHSHQDHADPETLRRMKKSATVFVGPFDSWRLYRECGIPGESCRLIHPGEILRLEGSTTVQATFALPTDATDLNHAGMLVRFANGTTERLAALLPSDVDVCALCINGGFHNLSPVKAAAIVQAIRSRVVLPCHYDMMINNVGSPEMLRVAMDLVGSNATYHLMKYYEPWVYQRD